jgi:hypothetical protein
MGKTALATMAAAVMLWAGAPDDRAAAMVLAAPEGARTALETISHIEKIGCWRYGWNGWGCYRWCPCYVQGYGWDLPRYPWCPRSGWYRSRGYCPIPLY